MYADAVVRLRKFEIHVSKPKRMGRKEDRSCVDVRVYKLPQRGVQVRETWCPGQFIPIIL